MNSGESHPLTWWLTNNPVLPQGYTGYVNDLGLAKIGNGVDPFSALLYQGQPQLFSWFSQFKPIQDQGSALSSAYNNCLLGGTFIQEGNWASFNFVIQATDNINEKTIYLKFANKPIFSLISQPITNRTIELSGKIKCIDYVNKKLSYRVTYIDSTGSISYYYGILTGIDFTQNQNMLLQLEGAATNDLIAEEGEGTYCTISLPTVIV